MTCRGPRIPINAALCRREKFSSHLLPPPQRVQRPEFGEHPMGYVRGLRCRACGAEFPAVQLAVCESCFGPLEVTYELSAVRDSFRREELKDRPRDLWRFRELLPVLDESARVDLA